MRPLAQPGRFRIKQAAPEELVAAARMKAAAWRESYPFAEEEFARQDAGVERRAQRWNEQGMQGAYFWIVVDSHAQNRVVGLGHAGVSEEPDAPTPLVLSMLYLLDVAKGSGIADRLLEMTIGDAPAYLWVLAGNERAIAFYRRHGFEVAGAERPLGDRLPDHREIRMVRG